MSVSALLAQNQYRLDVAVANVDALDAKDATVGTATVSTALVLPKAVGNPASLLTISDSSGPVSAPLYYNAPGTLITTLQGKIWTQRIGQMMQICLYQDIADFKITAAVTIGITYVIPAADRPAVNANLQCHVGSNAIRTIGVVQVTTGGAITFGRSAGASPDPLTFINGTNAGLGQGGMVVVSYPIAPVFA